MLDAGCIEAHEWPSSIATAQERMLWSMYNSVMGAAPVSRRPLPARAQCQITITCGREQSHHLPVLLLWENIWVAVASLSV